MSFGDLVRFRRFTPTPRWRFRFARESDCRSIISVCVCVFYCASTLSNPLDWFSNGHNWCLLFSRLTCCAQHHLHRIRNRVLYPTGGRECVCVCVRDARAVMSCVHIFLVINSNRNRCGEGHSRQGERQADLDNSHTSTRFSTLSTCARIQIPADAPFVPASIFKYLLGYFQSENKNQINGALECERRTHRQADRLMDGVRECVACSELLIRNQRFVFDLRVFVIATFSSCMLAPELCKSCADVCAADLGSCQRRWRCINIKSNGSHTWTVSRFCRIAPKTQDARPHFHRSSATTNTF